jgi:hypothetical protein
VDILTALNQQNKATTGENKARGYMECSIFKMELEALNLSNNIISDLMLEPADQRDNFLEYFRSRV